MYFSINAYKYIMGLEDTYRLKENGSFREQLNFKDFDEKTDMLFKDYEDAQRWLQKNHKVTIAGKEVHTSDKEVVSFPNTDYSFEILIHRNSKPTNQFPTISQVKEVLIKGDDNYNNSLLIDFDGFPRLVKLIERTPASLKGYAVRLETFGARNGYVGPQSHLNHLEGTYQALLESWLLHLSCGKEIYRDYSTDELTVQQLVAEINREITALN